ncbi:hypothetical protein D9M71_838880 [compost metagenome]
MYHPIPGSRKFIFLLVVATCAATLKLFLGSKSTSWLGLPKPTHKDASFSPGVMSMGVHIEISLPGRVGTYVAIGAIPRGPAYGVVLELYVSP